MTGQRLRNLRVNASGRQVADELVPQRVEIEDSPLAIGVGDAGRVGVGFL
jgi:hypothetical protein